MFVYLYFKCFVGYPACGMLDFAIAAGSSVPGDSMDPEGNCKALKPETLLAGMPDFVAGMSWVL